MKKILLLSSLVSATLTHAQTIENDTFREFKANETGVFNSHQTLNKGSYPLQFTIDGNCLQPQGKIKLNQTLSLTACGDTENITKFRAFRKGDYSATIDYRSGTPTLRLSVKKTPAKQKKTIVRTCPKWDGKPLNIDVSSTFADGEIVRDFYSGQTAMVEKGHISLLPEANSNGLLLLEKAPKVNSIDNKVSFDWHNATVYFVLTDRFYNGNLDNDNSYGRQKDGMAEIGTFHGGDLKGLTEKLDYIADLGVNAIWISSPLEQIHGWVGGGSKGDFPHYAYHGYYHQDWTKLDKNMGTEADLKNFITEAHKRDIRVLFDVVMNHAGYATLADMQQFDFGQLYLSPEETENLFGKVWTNWRPKKGENWHTFNDYVYFGSKTGWDNWWGKPWVRSDISNYDSAQFDDLKMSLSALPDMKTEATVAVTLPTFFEHKETNAKTLPNTTVRQYLIKWLSDWVHEYGIDGFRVDTAKHVEKAAWLALKNASSAALQAWQHENPDAGFNEPFWMTGEAWGHNVRKSDYYDNGFDAMINFDLQDKAKDALNCYAFINPTYAEMSEKLTNFNVLSYLSSHDTRLFFSADSKDDFDKQKIAGDILLLSPGAVQIYYGDETGRKFGATGSDPIQGTRSDMNWNDIASDGEHKALLTHWQKLSQFRQKHTAIGKGEHKTLQTKDYYAYSRSNKNDKVMVIWAGQ